MLRLKLLTRLLHKNSPAQEDSSKRPRRSERLSQHRDLDGLDKTPVDTNRGLPSPLTHLSTEETNTLYKEATATPPEGPGSQITHHRENGEPYSQTQGFSSPPQDTQAFPSQLVDSNAALSDEVEDEVKEGVWGYLFPLDTRYGGRCVVMRKRAACPVPNTVADVVSKKKKGKKSLEEEEAELDKAKIVGVPAGGYLIGRHPECGMC